MADTSTNGSVGSAGSAASASSGSGRQRVEYLAKARYQNTLPPPPFPPRLVNYDLDTTQLLNAGSLSSIFLQREINPEVDVELGIPIDLSVADGAFDLENSSEVMCPPEHDESELDAEDLVLLTEPEVSGVAKAGRGSFASIASSNMTPLSRVPGDVRDETAPSSSEIGLGTSFLRRTAYMSGETRRASKRKTGGVNAAAAAAAKETNVEAEVRRIEQTFQDAKVPLSELRHPKKKNVHAVRAAPVFPDLKETDLTFSEVRLVGSASLRSLNTQPSREQLEAAIFYHQKVSDEEGHEWSSLFLPSNNEDAQRLNKYRQELRDTLPGHEAQEEEQSEFAMEKLQENDFTVLRPRQRFEEVVISQNGEEAFLYTPISARYNLHRRRVDAALRQQLAEHEIDVLDLGLRELSAQESIQRDEVRSIYDPVNYG